MYVNCKQLQIGGSVTGDVMQYVNNRTHAITMNSLAIHNNNMQVNPGDYQFIRCVNYISVVSSLVSSSVSPLVSSSLLRSLSLSSPLLVLLLVYSSLLKHILADK